jgi:hypothetical protein
MEFRTNFTERGSYLVDFSDIHWDWNPQLSKDENLEGGYTGKLSYRFESDVIGNAQTVSDAEQVIVLGIAAIIPKQYTDMWYGHWLAERIKEVANNMTSSDPYNTYFWLDLFMELLNGVNGILPVSPINAKCAVWEQYPVFFDFWANTDEFKDARDRAQYLSYDLIDGLDFWRTINPLQDWQVTRAEMVARSYSVVYDTYAKVKCFANLFTNNN